MDALWTVLESVLVLMVGLAARFGLLLIAVAAMLAVVLPIVYASEGARAVWTRVALQKVGGLWWRPQAYYSPAHAWLRERGGRLRVGIDDLGAHLLARPEAVMLPVVGTHLREGDPLITLDNDADQFVVRSPVDGVIRRVNPRLVNRPEAMTEDPYRKGWLVEMSPSDRRYRKLAYGEAAREWFAGEAGRLSAALEHATGIAAADGGELVIPSRQLLTDDQLRSLAREFLGVKSDL